MFVEIFQTIFYFVEFILRPLNKIWDYNFKIELNLSKTVVEKAKLKTIRYNKIVILGVCGGSGKTTLAKDLAKRYMLTHIQSDKCKFGAKWKRYSPEEYEQRMLDAIKESNSRYVVEGTYNDVKNEKQTELFDKIIADSDLIIWNDIPLFIAVWRKLFRSFKRRIDVIEQCVSKETLSNIKDIIGKNIRNYDVHYKSLNRCYEKIDQYKCIRARFPLNK